MAALAPETLANISGFPITNTLLATLLIDFVLLVFVFYTAKHIKEIPGKFQTAVEALFSYFFDMAESMSNYKKAMSIFPWVMTFFIVIVATDFLGLMPSIGSVGFTAIETHVENEAEHVEKDIEEHTPTATHEETTHTESSEHETTAETQKSSTETHHKEKEEKSHLISLFRPATSDFNATLALAFISLLATHALAIKYTGLKDYLKRFFSLNPILLFVGLLELVSEFIKIFSLSFRLFGNIYAGEVVLATISGLFAFIVPLPFLLLESIVAVVQGLVFAMLTLVFMTILTKKHIEGGDSH